MTLTETPRDINPVNPHSPQGIQALHRLNSAHCKTSAAAAARISAELEKDMKWTHENWYINQTQFDGCMVISLL